MSKEVNEALLGAQYFPALRALFEQHFGGKVMCMVKPPQQTEAFIGFGQAWVRIRVAIRGRAPA